MTAPAGEPPLAFPGAAGAAGLAPAEVEELQRASARAVIRRSGPRLLRDALGPLALFFAGWKLIGLTAGIAMACAFGAAVYWHERRQGRPAAVVRMALVLVAIRAIVGLSSGSARVYLAQEIGIDVLLGTVVLGSLRTRAPFASWFVAEVFPLPEQLRRSQTFTRAMRVITTAWGGYFFARGLVRLAALFVVSTNSFVLVVALTDAPFLIALLAWSVRYATVSFRRSEQWAPVLAAEASVLAAGEVPLQPAAER